ncbi:MAG TPA: acylphosphatase [Bacteroidota bacterium]|jgi:acylphosphatase
MIVGAHIIVQGMVQGVGFRFFVHRSALRSGLEGYVRNLFNGEVEIEVEGDRSLIEELIKEVTVGPRAADVTHVKVDWKKPEHQFRRFEIR